MKITYRPEIDGLRAIAVGAVILYHAQISIFGHKPFSGGFIGVDIFFVISGYLITSIILKELVTTGAFSFKHFYERRVRRILPALLFVMLVSLPFAWMYLLPYDLLDFSKSIIYSIGFSSNFYFHFSGLEYGVGGLRIPFLHTWSLSVEEQYYILFPIVLLFIFKYFNKYLIHFLILGFLISLGSADWTSRNYPSVSFYFLHTRMWELLAGSILAYFEITSGHRSKNRTLNLILPSVGLFLILYFILFFHEHIYHPSYYTTIPILGACLIIWFSSKDELITKILSTKLFVGIGLISYSLYLWHYPIFVFIRKFGIIEGSNLKKLLFVFIIITLSIFSYYLIEKPLRKIKFKIIFIYLFFILALIISFCTYALTLKVSPYLTKYNAVNENLKLNYDYNNFSNKKNIFIIGNSYADNLFEVFYNNKELIEKYYFYTAASEILIKPNNKKVRSNYQIKCLIDFLEKKNFICDKNLFPFFHKQYKKSNYIIFAERFNFTRTFLDADFDRVIDYLKKDKKKFIIFLDDINHADILDIYIHRKGGLPSLNELDKLESELFKKVINWRKKEFSEIKDKFLRFNIKFLTRSELYCDYIKKKCPLIRNKNKIYYDLGHLTNNGANYFSKKISLIIEKLVNN